MVRSVSCVVALDGSTLEEAQTAGIPRERILIIPNGVESRLKETSCTSPIDLRNSVAFVGRLARQKRIATLLGAFARVSRWFELGPRLLIAGDGEERAILAERALQLGIGHLVTFLGWVPVPERVLGCAACLVNPSESEGLPNTVLEALACGVPVILSDIPVHREIAAATGMSDFLFPVGDEETLANRLTVFLGLSPEARIALGEQARRYVEPFSPFARDDAYFRLYQEVLTSSW